MTGPGPQYIQQPRPAPYQDKGKKGEKGGRGTQASQQRGKGGKATQLAPIPQEVIQNMATHAPPTKESPNG